MNQRLFTILNLSNQQERLDCFKQEIKSVFNPLDMENSKQFLKFSIQESLGLVLSRFLVDEFLKECKESPGFESDSLCELLEYALEQVEIRATAFEEQISHIRHDLADLYEEKEDFKKAAQILIGIPLESGHRSIEDSFKLEIYIRISRLLLEDEDSVGAESYLNRAGFLIHPESTPQLFQLQFKAAQARILDMKRQFLPAAQKYLELSLVPEMHVSEQMSALQSSLICSILAGAGPLRSKMLSTLYKDDRIQKSEGFKENGIYSVLEKMFLSRVLKQKEVEEFSKLLLPHQLAVLGDGSTVFDRAVTEHNILSVSLLYENITFPLLGHILGVSASKAEQMASKMILEKRLQGSIDQIESLLYFKGSSPMETWNKEIANLFQRIQDLVEKIAVKEPVWFESHHFEQ